MKWEYAQFERYQGVREYIDTAVIPFVGIDVGQAMEQKLQQAQLVIGISSYIEEQLVGRVMLFPTYSYSIGGLHHELDLMNKLTTHLLENGFKHVIWTAAGQDLTDISSGILGQLFLVDDQLGTEGLKQGNMREMGEQLLPAFIKFWENG